MNVTKNARERLLDEIMMTVQAWQALNDAVMQDRDNLRKRIAGALSMPDLTAEDLAADVDAARGGIAGAIATLRGLENDLPTTLEVLKGCDALLVPVAPYLRGTDFSDRIRPTVLGRLVGAWSRFWLGIRPPRPLDLPRPQPMPTPARPEPRRRKS